MANKEPYNLVTTPKGYIHKREITNTAPEYLVRGSKNVVINDADKVSSRKGFTLDGEARTVTKKIDSSVDWESKTGLRNVKAHQGATANTGKIRVRSIDYLTSAVKWQDIATSLATTEYCFTSWWNTTENQDVLLWVDGSYNWNEWSGGMGYCDTVLAGATTITLLGGKTWKESGFLSSTSGRAITIAGTSYTYTGGELTTTLTGVAALPTITAGTFVSQTVRVQTLDANSTIPSVFTPNYCTVQNNHVWVGSSTSRQFFVSKSTDYRDFTVTGSVRASTDGFTGTLDNCVRGFVEDDSLMYITAGNSDWYKIEKNMTADGTGEVFRVRKLRSGPGQAAISQDGIIRVKNGIIIITQEKTVDWLTNVQNISTPQALPLSDPVKFDFDSFNLDGATGKYFDDALWLTIPAENIVMIYDFDKQLWNPPQTLPLSSFAIADNTLFGHSNSSDETYELNSGYTDNGVSIDYIAAYAYRQYKDRSAYKKFDEYYNEVYMTTETELSVRHNFEFGGAEQVIENTIKGTDTALQFTPAYLAGLGQVPLGSAPLGSTLIEVPDLIKYRCIHTLKEVDFFEHQVVYFTSGGRFEILSHGPNVRMSTNIPASVTK